MNYTSCYTSCYLLLILRVIMMIIKKPIFVGDTLRSKLGYYVIVVKDGDSYGGKLVCEDNHSCKYISYALNKGAGHIKINCL